MSFIISGEKSMKKENNEHEIINDDIQLFKETPSDLIKAMEILRSPENMESNTILNNPQVNALSLMNWASQVFDIEFFKHYVSLFPKYRISGDDGRGRKELIEIAKAISKEEIAKYNRTLDSIGKNI